MSLDNRILGLLAHCVRNLEPHEAQAGCNVVVNLLSQRTPDEIVAVLQEAWAELGRFDGARERFGQVWDAVAKRVPGLAKRSLDEATSGHSRSTPRPRMPSYAERGPRVRPPWQTDERSSNDHIHEDADFRHILYCLRAIYERSVEMGGERRRVTFWAHDGSFSRGVFAAFCSDAALGFGGEVMEKWNSNGACSYPTKAVFATFEDDPRVLLVRMLGKDVSLDEAWFEHESFNRNPFNDHAFQDDVRTLIADAEITRGTKRNGDERRRRVERSRIATGSVDDEARFLTERVRAGELSMDRVEAAAGLGHPAARMLVQSAGSWPYKPSSRFFAHHYAERFPLEFVLLLLDMEETMLRMVRWYTHDPSTADDEDNIDNDRCTEVEHERLEPGTCPRSHMTPREIAAWTALYDGLRRALVSGAPLPDMEAIISSDKRLLPTEDEEQRYGVAPWGHWDLEEAESEARHLRSIGTAAYSRRVSDLLRHELAADAMSIRLGKRYEDEPRGARRTDGTLRSPQRGPAFHGNNSLSLFLDAWLDDALPTEVRPAWVRERLAGHILANHAMPDAAGARRNSDERLRDLEREARRGDPQAEERLRRERLRSGLPELFVPPARLESVLDRHGGFTAVTSGSRIGTNQTLWRPGRVLKLGVAGELQRHEGGKFYQNIEPVVRGYYKVRGYRFPVLTFWHELTGERIA